MKFIEAGIIVLAALFIVPGLIGVIDELTGVITDNLNVTGEVGLVLDAYPLFLIMIPIVLVVMLFRRRGGGISGQE